MGEKGKKCFVRYKTGAELYDVCQSTFEKWAKEAGAVCKVGKAVIVDCEVLDRYLEAFRLPAEIVTIRMSDEEHMKLRDYSEKHQQTITETIKKGVELLYKTQK